MSEKLENALKELHQSVDNFEKNFVANQNSNRAAQGQSLDQNDLFGLSQDPGADKAKNQAVTAVLDRTIHRMEKLVGENA